MTEFNENYELFDAKEISKNFVEKIREAYIFQFRRHKMRTDGHDPVNYGMGNMPIWDGGVDDRGRAHKSSWVRIAKFAAVHGVSPIRLVEAVFYFKKLGFPPRPPEIVGGQRVLNMYEHYITNFKADIKHVLVTELNLIDVRRNVAQLHNRSDRDVLLDVLFDKSLSISPLTAYCVSLTCGELDIAQRFHKKALYQFMEHPQIYGDVYDKLVPPSLKEELTKLNNHIAAGGLDDQQLTGEYESVEAY